MLFICIHDDLIWLNHVEPRKLVKLSQTHNWTLEHLDVTAKQYSGLGFGTVVHHMFPRNGPVAQKAPGISSTIDMASKRRYGPPVPRCISFFINNLFQLPFQHSEYTQK